MANGEPPLFGRRFTIISAVIVVLGLIYLVLRSDPRVTASAVPTGAGSDGTDEPAGIGNRRGRAALRRRGGRRRPDERPGQPDYGGGPAGGDRDGPAVERGARGGCARPGPSSPLAAGWCVAGCHHGSADDALLRVRRQQPSVPATDLRSALAKVGLTGTLAPLGLVGDGTQVVILEAASGTLVRLDLREPDNPQPTVVGRLPAGVNPLNMAPSADGGWLVVDFGPIPYEQGSGVVWHVSPAGQIERVVEGLTMPVDVTTGAAGELYVVELSAFYNRRTDRFTPGTGRVILARPGEGARPMLADLDFPTAIVRGADNNLYFTTHGAFGEPGSGGIARVPARTGFTTVTP